MKRLRYILAVVLSLVVVHAGAGVSIVHYCCSRCESVEACCTHGCDKCQKTHHHSEKSCKDEGCTATFHKVELVKQAVESIFTVPFMPLVYEQLPDYQSAPLQAEVVGVPLQIPPPVIHPRIYLALYSVLLI